MDGRTLTRDTGHLGALLLEEGVVSADVLERALEIQAERRIPLSRVLVEEKMVDERTLVRLLARHVGHEYVDLQAVTVDPAAASLVPESLARRYAAIPYAFEDGKLLVAMADPANVLALDDIRAISGRDVVARVATRGDVEAAVTRVSSLDTAADLSGMDVDTDIEMQNLRDVEAAAEEAPVVRLVNMLITRATVDRASDIHIEPTEKDLRIRFRIDGVLHEVMRTPRSIMNAVVSRLKIMSEIDIAERRRPQDGRINLRAAGRQIDLRVSTLPTIYGEKVVMRILDTSTATLGLPELGFLPDTLSRYAQSYNRPYGTILVTGPTGSGKTTTLYGTLNAINRPELNIITVEDPVEYRLPGINQVQVNKKAGLTFANALRSFLRQDPDVMLVGEIRDLETATIAIESALTGHLVLSTLHTNDAPTSISRLVEMGVEPFLVGSALDAVLAQRLARRLCKECKEPYQPSRATLEELKWPFEELGDEPSLHRAKGCGSCSNTGFRGRLAIFELLPVTDEIKDLILSRADAGAIRARAVASGMVLLREDGWDKVRRGVTTVEEVLRVTRVG